MKKNIKIDFCILRTSSLIFLFLATSQLADAKKKLPPIQNKEIKKELNKEDFPFKNIIDAETGLEMSTLLLQKKSSVWIVFQKGCSTCHKMMKETTCYESEKTHVLGFGILAPFKDLLKEARDHGFNGPVVVSEQPMAVTMGIDVTPTVFVFSKEKLVKRIDNYASCEQIKKLLL